MKKIAVLGAGSWGTALAMVLNDNGHQALLWSIDEKQVTEVNHDRTNKRYLPEIELGENIRATSDLNEAVEEAEAILFVLPTGVTRQVARDLAPLLNRDAWPYIIHASKGLEQESHKRISVILEEELQPSKSDQIVALSGPSHAEEVAIKDLTTVTVASLDEAAALYAQELFMNDYFRLYTQDDLIGVELGGALKNIYALGAGAMDAFNMGDNAKAALITRGLAEMSRLGEALGANRLTFQGLSGIGDLIVTTTSHHSRNWQAGNLFGQGLSFDEVLAKMDMVVEGIWTVKAAVELADKYDIEMPLAKGISSVIHGQEEAVSVIQSLMKREGKSEKI